MVEPEAFCQMSEKILIVTCSVPDSESAERLAALAVERRLAACANIQAPSLSIYRWRGEIERAQELTVMFKTTAHRYPELEALICSGHPYEIPEILAFEVRGGLEAYLGWVAAETMDDNSLPDGL